MSDGRTLPICLQCTESQSGDGSPGDVPHKRDISLQSTILGVDVGLNGAMAFLRESDLEVVDIPTITIGKSSGKRRREVDLYELARIIDAVPVIEHAYVEKVGAMRGDGPVGAFAFGRTYGAILAVLAANFIPVTKVAPLVWRRGLRIPATSKGDKSAVVARANELFPEHSALWRAKCHADRAEAALIALWGKENA